MSCMTSDESTQSSPALQYLELHTQTHRHTCKNTCMYARIQTHTKACTHACTHKHPEIIECLTFLNGSEHSLAQSLHSNFQAFQLGLSNRNIVGTLCQFDAGNWKSNTLSVNVRGLGFEFFYLLNLQFSAKRLLVKPWDVVFPAVFKK